MKRFKIKYQQGNNYLIAEIEAKDVVEAETIFYQNTPNADILMIVELTDDE